MTEKHADPRASIDALLALVRRELDLDVAFISRVDGDKRTFRSIVSDIELPMEVDDTESLEGTLCALIVTGRLDGFVPDVGADELTRDSRDVTDMGIGAYVGVPLTHSDGTLYGTLCAFSRKARREDTGLEATVLRATAALIMQLIESADLSDDQQRDVVAPVDAALLSETTIELLPVTDLETGAIVAYEAEPRFADLTSWRQRLTDARSLGRGVELELSVLSKAVALMHERDVLLVGVTLSPDAIVDPAFVAIVATISPSRLLVNIPVEDKAGDYDQLNEVLQPWRRLGMQVGVDRVGSGQSDMRHILLLEPDMIRIDVSGVAQDNPDRQRTLVVEALAAMAPKLDAIAVAIGCDGPEQRQQARDLGITHVSASTPLDV